MEKKNSLEKNTAIRRNIELALLCASIAIKFHKRFEGHVRFVVGTEIDYHAIIEMCIVLITPKNGNRVYVLPERYDFEAAGQKRYAEQVVVSAKEGLLFKADNNRNYKLTLQRCDHHVATLIASLLPPCPIPALFDGPRIEYIVPSRNDKHRFSCKRWPVYNADLPPVQGDAPHLLARIVAEQYVPSFQETFKLLEGIAAAHPLKRIPDICFGLYDLSLNNHYIAGIMLDEQGSLIPYDNHFVLFSVPLSAFPFVHIRSLLENILNTVPFRHYARRLKNAQGEVDIQHEFETLVREMLYPKGILDLFDSLPVPRFGYWAKILKDRPDAYEIIPIDDDLSFIGFDEHLHPLLRNKKGFLYHLASFSARAGFLFYLLQGPLKHLLEKAAEFVSDNPEACVDDLLERTHRTVLNEEHIYNSNSFQNWRKWVKPLDEPDEHFNTKAIRRKERHLSHRFHISYLRDEANVKKLDQLDAMIHYVQGFIRLYGDGETLSFGELPNIRQPEQILFKQANFDERQSHGKLIGLRLMEDLDEYARIELLFENQIQSRLREKPNQYYITALVTKPRQMQFIERLYDFILDVEDCKNYHIKDGVVEYWEGSGEIK